ncbi:histone H1-like [Hibiscus syriacus]|nr:histone H1-like [Hibiscus syriacus]
MAAEEPTVEVGAASETAEGNPGETKAATKSGRARKAKESKPKKAAAPKKPRASSTHPTYEEMIKDAIVSLKERTGSSQYAISKFIEGKQKQLPWNFKKLLLFHLKKLAAAGKLTKVKNSYKLPPESSSKPATTVSAPAKKKPVATKAKSKPASKAKEGKSVKSGSKAPAKKNTPKPKSKPAAKPKAAPKAKPAQTKTKAVASVKPNITPAARSKAAAKPKDKPVKAARTSTRSTSGKKAAPPPPPPPKPAAKKAPAKGVKTKSVNSPAKRTTTRRGRK